jgi:flavin-dependent dehydrogenase
MHPKESLMYDAVIVGGSFAGLAAAMQLRGRRVLLIDQHPIGTHQTSTCGIPVASAQAVGAEGSIQAVHQELILHTAGQRIPYALRVPYATFDYYAFCQAMLAQTDAEVWTAKATAIRDGEVTTTRGPVQARFVVDASGWQSARRQEGGPAREMRVFGYGTETELPVPSPAGPGLHFYWEKPIVRSGYAWVFPCGATTRIGVCSFDKGVRLGPLLDAFLARFGLECGATHGGVMAIQRRAGLAGQVLLVGDAAGQCLPVTAEGIRSALYYGKEGGRLLAAALDGTISDAEARARYATLVARKARFQALLLTMQAAIAAAPDWARAAAGRVVAPRPLIHRLVYIYLNATGWLPA